jgi:copper chaperone CopZ
MEKSFSITGLHCNACVNRVQRALSGLPGVEQVRVDLVSASVQIKSKNDLSTDQLNSLLEDLGEYILSEKT